LNEAWLFLLATGNMCPSLVSAFSSSSNNYYKN
jgi:hypothetical protein